MTDRPIDDQPNGSQGTPPAGDEPAGEQPGQQGAAEQAPGQDMWWYAVNGKSYGPVSERELVALARAGHFKKDDFVYAAYIGSWVRADSVHGLFDVVGPAGWRAAGRAGRGAAAAREHTPLPRRVRAVRGVLDKVRGGVYRRAAAGGAVLRGIDLDAWVVRRTDLSSIGRRVRHPDEEPADRGSAVPGRRYVAAWLYFGFMESSAWQATLGKRAVGIMVTDLDGHRISFARASGRYFASLLSQMIIYIGYIIGAFTERKQTLHDLIVSTVVVHGRPDEAVARR